MSRRGQGAIVGGTNTAILIGLIGVAIVVYILALPPEDRADLIGQNDSSISDGEEKTNISVLLKEEPGTLEFSDNDEMEIDFPSFNLYTRTDAIVIAEFDSIYLRRSLFSKDFVNVTFSVDELRLTENILLSFFAKEFSGRLTVKLNGHILMNRILDTSSPEPIQLPKELIKDLNILEFEISGPGLAFWKANQYLIENLKITADLTDVSGQENKQVFLLTEKEKELLEYAEIELVADCVQTDVSPLEIYINKKLIYSSIPDCGIRMPIPQITKDKLLEGENFIRFRSDKGSYLIYGVKITLKLEEPVYPTYYFQIDGDELYNIEKGYADLNLTILFPNKIDYKKGVVLINHVITEIETRENEYTRDIGPYVREGNNALEIRPKADELDIVEVKIIYAE